MHRIAVGTGQALALGASGDADIVLVHARSREDAFVAAGHGIDRRDVMWNDFLIVKVSLFSRALWYISFIMAQ